MTSVTQRGLSKVLAVSLVLPGEIREGFTEERTVEFSLEGRHKNRTGGKGHFRQRDRSIVTRSCVCESDEYSGGWNPGYPRQPAHCPLAEMSTAIPVTREYAPLHGGRDFFRYDSMKDFELGRLSWIFQRSPSWSHESLKVENLSQL